MELWRGCRHHAPDMKLPRLRVFLPWSVGIVLLLAGGGTALRGVEPVHSLALLPPEQAAQKYGIFVHYVWGGASGKTITVNPDGSRALLNSTADVENSFHWEHRALNSASRKVRAFTMRAHSQ